MSSSGYQQRPKTIRELTEYALDNLYDENKPLKHYLKLASQYRLDGKDYYSKGDLENAFIYFARAVTLVLDKLPTHREYHTILNADQRSNVLSNGSSILKDLDELKLKLIDRYEWMWEHPDGEEPTPSASTGTTKMPQNDPDSSPPDTRSKGNERGRGRHSHQHRIQEDPSQRQDDSDIDHIKKLAERERERSRGRDTYSDRGVTITQEADATREAALMSQTTPSPNSPRLPNGHMNAAPDSSERGSMASEYDRQLKPMGHRAEISRERERKRDEILGWLKESEAARAARPDPPVFDDIGSRECGLARQSSISSISSVASSASSTLFQRRSPTPSKMLTPTSSFYLGSDSTSLCPPSPVMDTNLRPTSMPPTYIAMPSPEPIIPPLVSPRSQPSTPPQATKQAPEQALHPQSPPLTTLTSPPSSPRTPLLSPRLTTIRTLLTRLNKLRAVGASLVNYDTFSLLCGLLDSHDATIVSEVETDSDAELLVDFLLHVLRRGSLTNSNRVIQDPNRKARRLMFKLISKIDVIPRSLFITDIEKEPQAMVAGGFGNVFKGKHDTQLVALKMLYKGHREGDSIKKHFCIEALTWRSLSHRFILPFLGIYEEGSQLYLVSPFMANGALRDWRKEHTPVRVDEIQRLLLEVAEGVQYIHSDGIVHGDLHGGNVLLDSEFHCQITDFGSTRLSEATVTRSTTALAVNFAAPELFGSCAKCGELECNGCYEDLDEEQHRGKTIKTDVYAFACLYYAIFFDTVPFRENNYLQVMRLVTSGVRPKRLNVPIMADYIWNLVQMCWKSNPSERPMMEEIVTMLISAP